MWSRASRSRATYRDIAASRFPTQTSTAMATGSSVVDGCARDAPRAHALQERGHDHGAARGDQARGLPRGTTGLGPTTSAACRWIDMPLGDAAVAAFAGAFLGCLTTECFTAFGIGPDIASATATVLLCGLLLVTRMTRRFAGAFFPALYGGTFAGMTPIVWLGDSASGHSAAAWALSIALSIVCGLAFFVVAKLDARSATPVGVGYGGRLGAIATVASFLFIALAGPSEGNSRFPGVGAEAFHIEPWPAILGFFACLAGTIVTLATLRQRRIADRGAAQRTFIAAAAALSGLMILQLGHPDDAHIRDAFYAGCFLGMSTPGRLKGWFQPVLGALMLIVMLMPAGAFLRGVGGRLGLAAFVTVMLLVALCRATAWTTRDT
jgi:hypothetical protein